MRCFAPSYRVVSSFTIYSNKVITRDISTSRATIKSTETEAHIPLTHNLVTLANPKLVTYSLFALDNLLHFVSFFSYRKYAV